MGHFSRFVPLIALLVFFFAGAVARSVWQRRQHGTFGFALSRRDLLGAVGLPASVLIQSIVAALAPRALERWTLTTPAGARIAGLAILAAATVLMVLAQLDLGASWRIGIERDARPGLVTRGFYCLCRNPIFAFMLVALVGAALLLPTVGSLAVLVAAYAAVRAQILKEESWLTTAYGDAYLLYASRVGRFTPWTGRLHRTA